MNQKKRVIHIDKRSLGEATEMYNIKTETDLQTITYPWFLITTETKTTYTLTTLNNHEITLTKENYTEMTKKHPGCTTHTFTPAEATNTVLTTGEDLIADAALVGNNGTATETNTVNNISEYFAALLIHKHHQQTTEAPNTQE